ncbi:MAG TPA: DUF255 domain-containing protein [Phycisphaerae bacterium]|nr:DUF255 domain-containing protein [Phycisphaerae bacterium]
MKQSLIMVLLVLTGQVAWAQSFEDPDLDNFDQPVEQASPMVVVADASATEVAQGEKFQVKLKVTITKGWSWYSPNPGPYALAGDISVVGDGFTIDKGKIVWAKAIEYKTPGMDFVNQIYKGTVEVIVPITVAKDAGVKLHNIRLNILSQVCHDSGKCVQLEGRDAVYKDIQIKVTNPSVKVEYPPVKVEDPPVKVEESEDKPAEVSDDRPDYSMFGGFALAVLAGLMMNFTPCVLPIIPLRIYGIVQMAGDSRKRFITLGLAFAGGILLFFVLIALLNIGLSLSISEGFRWSDQWQFPLVRAAMVLILVVVAANMFGLFTVTVPKKIAAIDAGTNAQAGQGHISTTGMGLMMAILSTPCTVGPIVLVLGWAQGEGILTATTVFVLLGIGMAAPHAVLAAFPDLLKLLPKPGVWMEWFKQSMGFAVLAVAAYLLSSFSANGYVGWVALYAVLLSFCLWVWGTWVRYDATLKRKLIIRGLAVALAIGGGWYMLRPPAYKAEAGTGTENISFPKQIEKGRLEGNVVVVKFTATWCTACKVVDKKIFGDSEVQQRLASGKYIVIKGDTTDRPMPANVYIRKYFPAQTIPLTVVYSPDNTIKPIQLAGIYSKEDFFKALDKAMPKQKPSP